GRMEQLRGVLQVRGRRVPEVSALVALLRYRAELVRALLSGRTAVALVVDPLGEGGEALVEPDVGPRGRGDRVAEPLVPELVNDRRDVRDVPVVGAGLRLERVPDGGRRVEDPSRRAKGVGAVEVGQEADDLRLGV